jgi:hypothetical protein
MLSEGLAGLARLVLLPEIYTSRVAKSTVPFGGKHLVKKSLTNGEDELKPR